MAGRDFMAQARSADPTAIGRDLVPYTPQDADLPDGVRGVCFNGAGTADIKNSDGTAVTGVKVQEMVPMVVLPRRVTGMTGPTVCYLIVG